VDELPATLVRLNLETRTFHASADTGWLGLLTPDVTRTQYVDQLVRMYGFEGPLEAAFAYTPNLELVVDVHDRYRAGFIAQDLLALGSKPAQIARLPQHVIAPFASPLEALGWMYVVERWTLLHDEVRRYIRVRLPEATGACVYLGATEGYVQARWQDLGRRLDRVVRSQRMFDDVLAGAHSAFRAWGDWSTRDVTLRRQG
jgi:heme oxygenase